MAFSVELDNIGTMDEAVDEGSARLVTTQAAEENTSAPSEKG